MSNINLVKEPLPLKLFTDNASKADINIFKKISRENRLNNSHNMGYDLVNTIRKALKNKTEKEVSDFTSFIFDEWRDIKQNEDSKKNKKSK